MANPTILVGVDASDESVAAANAGRTIADASGGDCVLVHITADISRMPATLPPLDRMDELMARVQAAARKEVDQALRGRVSDELVDGLQVRMGRAAWILPFVVEEFEASLLVLGRKRHSGPVRWFGGSTAHHLLRTLDIPLLIADPANTTFKRFLVAVDGSHAAPTVLKTALEFASQCGAEVRVIHVIEPVPYLGEFPMPLPDPGYDAWARQQFEEFMDSPEWRDLDRVVEHGPASAAIPDAATRWEADLVIAGTHGAGWIDRLLVGSTTQRLLNRLPGSLYVVPVGAPSEGENGG